MEDNIIDKLYSKKYGMSTEVLSNSKFYIVRELETAVSQAVAPIFILLENGMRDKAVSRLETTLNDMTQEGEPFYLLYKFGQYLGKGLIPNPYTIKAKDFKKILDSNLSKAFSFEKAVDFLGDAIKRFVENAKNVAEIGIDKVARWLKGNIQIACNNAFQGGLVDSLSEGENPEDVYVIKIVYPGACKYCRQLYLNADGSPKVFRLSELMANGNDPYRKPADYLPVLAGLHPYCRCQTVKVNKNWDSDKLFDVMTEAWTNYAELMKEYEDSLEEQPE